MARKKSCQHSFLFTCYTLWMVVGGQGGLARARWSPRARAPCTRKIGSSGFKVQCIKRQHEVWQSRLVEYEVGDTWVMSDTLGMAVTKWTKLTVAVTWYFGVLWNVHIIRLYYKYICYFSNTVSAVSFYHWLLQGTAVTVSQSLLQ